MRKPPKPYSSSAGSTEVTIPSGDRISVERHVDRFVVAGKTQAVAGPMVNHVREAQPFEHGQRGTVDGRNRLARHDGFATGFLRGEHCFKQFGLALGRLAADPGSLVLDRNAVDRGIDIVDEDVTVSIRAPDKLPNVVPRRAARR